MFDVENIKFLTDFIIDHIRSNRFSENYFYFDPYTLVQINNEQYIINVTDGGLSKITSDPSQRIPYEQGFFSFIKDNVKVYQSMKDSTVKFEIKDYQQYQVDRFYNDEIAILYKKFQNASSYEKLNRNVVVNNYGEFLTEFAYGFDIKEEFSRFSKANKPPPRYIIYATKEKENGPLSFNVADIISRKKIFTESFEKIKLFDPIRVYFIAFKNNRYFILDTLGKDHLSEYISFNSIPFYVNKQYNVCIGGSISEYDVTTYRLYDLDGNLLNAKEFYTFEVVNDEIILLYTSDKSQHVLNMKNLTLESPNKTENLSSWKTPFMPNLEVNNSNYLFSKAVTKKGNTIFNKVRYFQPVFGSYFFFEHYDDDDRTFCIINLKDNKPKKFIDKIIDLEPINDTLFIISYLEKIGLIKTGVYDFKNESWLNFKVDNEKLYDFSPLKDIVIKSFVDNIFCFKDVKDDNYTYIDIKEKKIVNQNLKSSGTKLNNRIDVIYRDGRKAYWDSQQNEVIKFPDNVKEISSFAGHHAFIKIEENNKKFYVLIDTLGNQVAGGEEFTEGSFWPSDEYVYGSLKAIGLPYIKNNLSTYTKYQVLNNGKLGITVEFNWDKYHKEQDQKLSNSNCDKSCRVCGGSCSYLYVEDCEYCIDGMIEGPSTTEVISLGGVRTEKIGNTIITKYEQPVIFKKRNYIKCPHCNGTGNKPDGIVEIRKCYLCSPKY